MASPGHRDSFSSDSDDEEEWSQLQKKSKKKKVIQLQKKSKEDLKLMHLEEGEISSDELDDDEDDGLDDNLIGGEDDKRKLEKMSEKEREEELFKRAERRDAIRARRAVKQKLKEKRDRERAEKAGHVSKTSLDTGKPKKTSAYSNVFSSDSDEVVISDSSGAGGLRGLRERKIALEKRKEAHSNKFQELIERRRQQAAKKRRFMSESDDEHEVSANHDTSARLSPPSSLSESDSERRSKTVESGSKRAQPMSQRVFSSDASDSTDSSRPGVKPEVRRPSVSSSSASQHSDSSSDDDRRGRSRSPEEQLVSTVSELSRIRLSRFKMEKWVHMPFFNDLIKGCFVRISIGFNQGIPVYRCAEVVGVEETEKIYDLGSTRTNKRMIVQIGKDKSAFQLAFVSNSDFLPSEFDSWMRRIADACMKPPTIAFVQSKMAEIQEAISRPIRDERLVEQIIQSKKRFQRAPTNFAMRKAELMKERELAEADGNTKALRQLDSELEEIELQAESIDRRRTSGFKSITSINQRNRMLSVQQAEEAIRKESEEAQKSHEEDPFTRIHSQPVIVTKKYLEQLRFKRTGQPNPNATKTSTDAEPASITSVTSNKLQNNASLTSAPGLDTEHGSSVSTPHDSLHAIHNFEININLDMEAVDQPGVNGTHPAEAKAHTNRLNDTLHSRDSLNGALSAKPATVAKSTRRLLNLQEYKKRHGLI